MKRIGPLALVLLGATFWAPTVAMFLASRWVFNVVILTVVTVAFSGLVFVPVLYSRHRLAGPGVSSLLLLVGIWLSGPSLIAFALSLLPGQIHEASVPAFSVVELISPVSLLVASTYSGTLGALLIVSLWLGATAVARVGLFVFRRPWRAA